MAGLFLILRNRLVLLPYPVTFLSIAEFSSKPLSCLPKALRTLLYLPSFPTSVLLSSWTIFLSLPWDSLCCFNCACSLSLHGVKHLFLLNQIPPRSFHFLLSLHLKVYKTFFNLCIYDNLLTPSPYTPAPTFYQLPAFAQHQKH